MSRATQHALGASIAQALGAAPAALRPIGGGDINEAYAAELADGRRLFLKTHPSAPPAMYPREAEGLRWLAEAEGGLRTPEVIAFTEEGAPGPRWLALELLEPGPRGPRWSERMGRGLAALHRASAPAFGGPKDNFLGSLPQENRPQGREEATRWAAFYRARRLQPLLRRAVDEGLASGAMRRGFARLFAVMEDRCAPEEPPARLHGDLWGGNVHTDRSGAPCLIDPAAYGGHREIDLAMMRLFGGFDARVFAAYEEAHPLAPGHRERVPLYQLYPLLAHVCLFGGGYVSSVERALDSVI